ncbi:hypothetical protein ABZ915_17485 [Streptomyces sp. NPDC046915]
MARVIEMPPWFLALLVVTAGAIGGGACAAIDLAVRAVLGRR